MNKIVFLHRPILALLLLSAGLHSLATTEDYAAWKYKNKDGTWTKHTEKAVQASNLPQLHPQDIADFCPNYANLELADKVRFWTGLLSAMAQKESSFNSRAFADDARLLKPGPKKTAAQSVADPLNNPTQLHFFGLLQISYHTARSKAFSCDVHHPSDLYNPVLNLSCAARILSYAVTHENQISANQPSPRGGARYWSVLRSWRNHLPYISGFTRSLNFCQTPDAPTVSIPATTPPAPEAEPPTVPTQNTVE